MRGQHLLLQAADRQHAALQRDLAGHADRAASPAGRVSSDAIAVTIVTPALGPSLGIAPAGTCTWNSRSSKASSAMPSSPRVAAHVGERDARRLLHDVAELAGEHQPAVARHRRGLDEEHVAAGAGDRETGGHARHRGALRRLLEELRPAERLAHQRHVDRDRRRRRARTRSGSRSCAAACRARARAAARRPRACSPTTTRRSTASSIVDLLGTQAVALDLARPQVAARDRHLLRRSCSRRSGSPPCGRAAGRGWCRPRSRWR